MPRAYHRQTHLTPQEAHLHRQEIQQASYHKQKALEEAASTFTDPYAELACAVLQRLVEDACGFIRGGTWYAPAYKQLLQHTALAALQDEETIAFWATLANADGAYIRDAIFRVLRTRGVLSDSSRHGAGHALD